MKRYSLIPNVTGNWCVLAKQKATRNFPESGEKKEKARKKGGTAVYLVGLSSGGRPVELS
jgi:hypothetical protein